MRKWLPSKLCEWALNAVSDLPRSYWRSTPGKQALKLPGTVRQFEKRLSDNQFFYEQSYSLFVREKVRSRAEFIETSDTVIQRTRQQCSQRQAIAKSRSVDTSLMDEFRQPGKNSEGFSIGSSCVVSRKGAFSKDLFGEVEDTRIAQSGSGIRIPGSAMK